MFDDFPKSDIFGQSDPGPFPEEDIDGESEQHDPWEGEYDLEERFPPEECVPDDGDEERFDGEDDRYPGSFFDLGCDEFLREGDHDEEGEDGHRCESGAALHPAEDEDAEDREGDDGECDGDAGEVEQTESLEEPAREHSDHDDCDENGDAVFHAVWIEGEEREGDDRWGIDAEGFDPDHLAENGDERRDDRQEEEERHRLERNAGVNEKCDERMDGHTVMKYLITNIKFLMNASIIKIKCIRAGAMLFRLKISVVPIFLLKTAVAPLQKRNNRCFISRVISISDYSRDRWR